MLTGNTPNVVLDHHEERSRIPLAGAIEETLKVAKATKSTRVGLLGTVFTYECDVLPRLVRTGWYPDHYPNTTQKSYIQQKIEMELEQGIVTEQTRQGLIDIIRSM